jgi:shikimate 5-dehydrogenase
MDLLDQVDPLAVQIGAVNTIRRTHDGRLVGYNTDASGAVKSLMMPSPWQPEPFMEALLGKSVLLIGAGGAGRAAAFALARELGSDGRLYVANRSLAHGSQLADQVSAVYGNAQAAEENVPREVLADVDLVINSSTKGQSGLRHLGDGMVTCLEPYSALAPAAPAVLVEAKYPDHTSIYDAWYRASASDIKRNLAASDEAMLHVRSQTRFFDMVYAPLETPMLLQARLKGHATVNGKGMNIMQAVDAFVSIVLEDYFKSKGWNEQQSFEVVQKSMAAAW